MILVVGATGTTGSVVVEELLARGEAVRAVTRSPESAEALRACGAEVAVGDVGDPASLARAFVRVERMYLALPESEDQCALETNAIALAEQSGVYHVVKLRCAGQVHDEIVDQLQQSSLRWTVLRAAPGVPATAVAELAVRALTEPGHENSTYELGPPA